jgi:translocation protein SEC66
MVNWIGLAFPFIYLGILVGSLATFSSLYRRRKACTALLISRLHGHANVSSTAKAAHLEPWFSRHISRDVYLSLLHIEPQPGEPKIPDGVLKAALLRRATEDILRIFQIRNSKQALSTLLQRGSVGDELWQRFLRAEKEIDEEVRDVASEVRFSCRQTSLGTANSNVTGKRFHTELGPAYLPVRKRDGR